MGPVALPEFGLPAIKPFPGPAAPPIVLLWRLPPYTFGILLYYITLALAAVWLPRFWPVVFEVGIYLFALELLAL